MTGLLGTTRESPNRMAVALALRGDGGVRDPLEDWIRKDAALADTFSLQHPGVDRTGFGLELVKVVQSALTAEVAGRQCQVGERRGRSG